MNKVCICSGSLRSGSLNTALVRAACALFPDQLSALSIREFPLYNQDLENREFPAAVLAFQQALHESPGLIVVSPEYNRSVSGVMKNALDWCSRAAGGYKRVLEGKAVALAGASPGRFGTSSAQSAWLPVMSSLGANVWGGSPFLAGGAGTSFDENGALTDSELQERLQHWIEGFLEFAQERAGE